MGTTICPCGSRRNPKDCCSPYLLGQAHPPTAEALMRSRYVAYTQQKAPYLLATWHPDTRPPSLRFDPNDDLRFVQLEIMETTQGQATDSEGEVTFQASYRTATHRGMLREKSRFVRLEGRWIYVDGDVSDNPLTETIKTGRNSPCPCGSGKKHKRCCCQR